ncbi:MAG: phage tail protein [Clostridia bacterium]|nr:phage tail protein [Clostridia bacterium]
MIPILYAKNESTFTHNGIGFLKDATKCTVTEERNGSYECSLQYPITGQWYDQITEGCIIKAKANDTSEPQLFRIYKSSKPLKGIVTYSAEHISYDLNGIPTLGFSVKNVTPQAAITRAIQDAGLSSAFTAISDISTLNSSTILTPCSVRAILGGQAGSVLDVWGGEFEFDNFVVKLHRHRGSDRGVSIEYGKNLKDLKQEANIADCYTHLMPYARYSQDGEGDEKIEVYVYLSEKVLPLNNAENIGHSKAYIMDFTDRFGEGEAVTEEALRAKATAYAAAAELGVPKVNITVSFIQLWQTEEYKNIAPLERVMMCDTVAVRFSKLGVTARAKVIKTTYNTLEEKYDSVELGDAKSSFADTVNKQQAAIEEIKTSVQKGQVAATEQLKKAIANATSLITGHSGGYVVLNPAEKPQEILILDAPTLEEAVNVWRWNSGGLGYSSTGYNGEYALAMTMDGAIVADFINAGILNGALLQADSVQASSISQEYKTAVTNEIGVATSSVEQAFIAADEHLLSVIKGIETVFYGDIETLETTISTLEQKIDSLTLSYTTKTTGGINNIRNSSGLNGVSDDWSYTGSVVAQQTADAVNNTASGSMFRLRVGTLSQEITVLQGKEYTLTFKAKRGTANRCYVLINNGGNDTFIFDEQAINNTWAEYYLTFTAAGNTVTLTAGTTGYYLYVADFMLAEGSQKQNWTPAPNEIYTENVKIDRRGINITNSESSTETIIDHTQFAVKHAGAVVLTVNKDLTTLRKTEVTDELTVGKGKFVPQSAGLDIVLLD